MPSPEIEKLIRDGFTAKGAKVSSPSQLLELVQYCNSADVCVCNVEGFAHENDRKYLVSEYSFRDDPAAEWAHRRWISNEVAKATAELAAKDPGPVTFLVWLDGATEA